MKDASPKRVARSLTIELALWMCLGQLWPTGGRAGASIKRMHDTRPAPFSSTLLSCSGFLTFCISPTWVDAR